MEIWNEGKRNIPYRSARMTDKEIVEGNVRLLVECGRARWKDRERAQ
jgi:hypothetical protein